MQAGELRPERGRLLDVGCGAGVFLSLARVRGWDVRGVENSAAASRYAGESVGVEMGEGMLKAVSHESGTFDVVTKWDSIEHVAHPLAVLREVRRIFKPGGYVMLHTPNEAGLLKLIARVCCQATFGLFRYPVTKLYHVCHLYYCTPSTLVLMLERERFKLKEIERVATSLGARLAHGEAHRQVNLGARASRRARVPATRYRAQAVRGEGTGG